MRCHEEVGSAVCTRSSSTHRGCMLLTSITQSKHVRHDTAAPGTGRQPHHTRTCRDLGAQLDPHVCLAHQHLADRAELAPDQCGGWYEQCRHEQASEGGQPVDDAHQHAHHHQDLCRGGWGSRRGCQVSLGCSMLVKLVSAAPENTEQRGGDACKEGPQPKADPYHTLTDTAWAAPPERARSTRRAYTAGAPISWPRRCSAG